MIQRIQTVFLFILAALLFVGLFESTWKNTGFYEKSKERVTVVLDPQKTIFYGLAGDGGPVQEDKKDAEIAPPVKEKKNNLYIGAMMLIAALNSVFIIFQYKKRMLQIKLAGLTYVLLAGVLTGYYYLIKTYNLTLTEHEPGDFLIGFYIPIICIILNFLAIRFIRKDEALVRSVDRIR